MEKISAVILTFNEERNIAMCIDSVIGVADEIIVIDSYSTDKTMDICRNYKEIRLLQNPFEGYIEQKNFGKELATFDWVLSLDADEVLSDELRESILNAKKNFKFDGYLMNRLTYYCGKWIKHSGWYPDRKMRLFNRQKGIWVGLNPHDKFVLNKGAKQGSLKGDILHYSYYTFEEHEQQVQRFSEIAARSLYKKGVKSGYLKMMYKPLARFVKSYIVKQGFKDGVAGLTIARMTAKASFLRYKKLYRLYHPVNNDK